MTNFRPRSLAALAIAGGLTLAACGGSGSGAQGNNSQQIQAGTPAEPQDITLPSVEVLDTATGDRTQFADLVPAERPTLLWFWAPH